MLPGQDNKLRKSFREADQAGRQRLAKGLPNRKIYFDGLCMFVHPSDNMTERQIWLRRGPPEPNSLQALTQEIIGKTALILDVGANCGLYSLWLAKHAGPGSTVLAFEPHPEMRRRLAANLAINDCGALVEIKPCALGNERGQAVLHQHASNYGQNTLDATATGLRESLTVTQCVLEDQMQALPEYDTCIIKVDVEGWEPQVLLPWISQVAPDDLPDAILVETKHAENWAVDLIGALKSRNYQVKFTGEGNTLFSLSPANPTQETKDGFLYRVKKRTRKWLN